MRKICESADGKMKVHVVSGTYVILLGIDIEQEDAQGLLGFAIQRKKAGDKHWYWLTGMKVFQSTTCKKGELVDTNICPVQGFLWQDFTVSPDIIYSYRVIGMTGEPGALIESATCVVDVEIQTEKEEDETHSIWFNRGFAGSQAYSRKFGLAHPDKVANGEALTWLSRGLFEAFIRFLNRAKDSTFALRGAFYEFSYAPALEEFVKAAARTNLKLVIDMRINKTGPRAANQTAIAAAGIPGECIIPRTQNPSYIAHNKFIVLLENNKPVAVWTGSTNLTENGIFGQSNIGHVVNDPQVAQTYLDYWNELATDPRESDIKKSVMSITPNDPLFSPQQTLCKFSPRQNVDVLNGYSGLAQQATQSVFFTSAFGIGIEMAPAFSNRNIPSYILMESEGMSASVKATAAQLLGFHSNLIAMGSGLSNPVNGYEHWLNERYQAFPGGHVHYIHDKFMIVDPLSDNPIVISGSANFSKPSTVSNDENILVIHGEKRVADIYLTEFIRIWRHYYFRGLQKTITQQNSTEGFLKEDSSWMENYYNPGSKKYFERTTFRITP